ncbi:hypothetical protein MMB17_18580 [Methylobacterium organophilum]|uniref:hypothetical protein n=1 Tax=Methylobacterium organophilum TaxID=410 RepID=UPI001F1474F2|nr:hypothetical protein [Methylobacterium organophilum]UMY16669.1 hypothetical protein MMB17_18580 [Methylobacterium organophilum]
MSDELTITVLPDPVAKFENREALMVVDVASASDCQLGQIFRSREEIESFISLLKEARDKAFPEH